MTERERVELILTDLALPAGQFLVSGSAVMFLHGIQREKPLGDLDLFVATRVWFDLYRQVDLYRRDAWELFTTDPDDVARRCDPPYLIRSMYGIPVHVFFAWRSRGVGDIDCNLWMHNAEIVGGWPCIPLYMLLDWKVQIGRAKDATDIRLIAEHLERQEA